MELTDELINQMNEDFKKKRLEGEKKLIREINSVLFEEVPLITFEEKILALSNSERMRFINSCLFVIESPRITTKYECIKTVLLFVAIETLMSNNVFLEFKDWIITKKEKQKGVTQRKAILNNIEIDNIEKFNNTIEKLYGEYINHHGVTNKVRDFFINYIDIDSKKELIKSISFNLKGSNDFVYKCFISKEKCFPYPNYSICREGFDECQLENLSEIDIILSKLIPVFYGYFRSGFLHSGKQGHTADTVNCSIDVYDDKPIKVTLSREQLKSIIIKGLRNYYFRHIGIN